MSTVKMSNKNLYYFDKIAHVSGGHVSLVDLSRGPITHYLNLIQSLRDVTNFQQKTRY